MQESSLIWVFGFCGDFGWLLMVANGWDEGIGETTDANDQIDSIKLERLLTRVKFFCIHKQNEHNQAFIKERSSLCENDCRS